MRVVTLVFRRLSENRAHLRLAVLARGFEPRLIGSEPTVLPLDEARMEWARWESNPRRAE